MLHELYKYAMGHGLAARPGFKSKRVKCHVMLSATGRFLGIDPCPDATTYCPDIGAAANGTTRCNILAEKACIPLCIVKDPVKDKNIPTKHQFFLDALAQGAAYEPAFDVVRAALEDEQIRDAITQALTEAKYKAADVIGFQVDGQSLESSPNYLEWWNQFRQQFAPPASDLLPRCFITGQAAPALATVPKVSGLMSVGGHTAGDAFLCFDKDAFQSYGLKKSFNAPVSEEAMTAVNAALTALIAAAPTFGGAKLVHWYSGPVDEKADLIPRLLDITVDDDEEDTEEAGKGDRDAEREALAGAKRLAEAIQKGELPQKMQVRYYIMPLSGANGRMMVRGWYEGSYVQLYQSVTAWFDDLRLATPYEEGVTRPPKLKALCIRLLKPGDQRKVFERMDKELPNLLGRLFAAIVQNQPLPDEVAARALLWLRSDFLRSSGSDASQTNTGPETLAYQLLKAWLRRRQKRKEGANLMGESLQTDRENAAYQCGRLMAVYASVQTAALGKDLGAGVLERYYATACTAPKLVLGKLSALSQHHLSKLERGLAVYYMNMLGEIASHIPQGGIPASLTLTDQAEFALGYYHQRAEIFTKKASHTAEAEKQEEE